MKLNACIQPIEPGLIFMRIEKKVASISCEQVSSLLPDNNLSDLEPFTLEQGGLVPELSVVVSSSAVAYPEYNLFHMFLLKSRYRASAVYI